MPVLLESVPWQDLVELKSHLVLRITGNVLVLDAAPSIFGGVASDRTFQFERLRRRIGICGSTAVRLPGNWRKRAFPHKPSQSLIEIRR
jgi:hypothetical protein